MQRASDKAYVSKRLIEKYQKEKEKQSRQSELQPIQEQNEDIAMQESIIQKAGSVDLIAKLEIPQNLSGNDDDSDLSGEDVDSDDLGEDITQKRGQPQQQQQILQQPQLQSMFNAAQFQNNLFQQQQPQQMHQMMQPQNLMMQQQQPQQLFQNSFNNNSMPQPQQMQQAIQTPFGFVPPQQQISSRSSNKINSSNKRQRTTMPQQQQQVQQQPQQMMPQPQQYLWQQKQMQPQNMMPQPQQQLWQQQQVQPQNTMSSIFPPGQTNQGSKQKYRQQVDTNVFQVSMSCLKDSSELATGDPIYCGSCQGVFNKFSVIEEHKEKEEQIWVCEFCNNKNKVSVDPEEIPKTDIVNYIIEAAAQVEEKKQEEGKTDTATPTKAGSGLAKDISIIYCVDISGSMSYRSGASSNRQVIPTRLQCVQETIIAQIKDANENNPDRKLGLVTFTDTICVVGDACLQDTSFGGQELNNYNFILKNGIACAQAQLNKPIKDSKNQLETRVKQMQTAGSTALGPGLLTSIAMAGEGSPGSQVIVCTDGMSNVGLGTLSNRSEVEQQASRDFYQKCGEYAQSKGVTVHIVTIIGQDCNIDAISSVAELTGGQIERVDPTDISKNFKDFLAKPVLATQVSLKVKLHKGLEFRNEPGTNLNADKTILTKEFGNVNEDTDITFEYKLKSIKELIKMTDIDLMKMTHFPFQAQIFYSALDGSKCVRIITNRMEISSDKEELEKKADYEILGINAIQQSSKLARQGDYKKAQINAKAWDNRLLSNAISINQQESVSNYRSNVNGIYNMMYQQQQVPQMQMMMPQQQQMQQQIAQMSDHMSQQFYANSKINRSQFNKK